MSTYNWDSMDEPWREALCKEIGLIHTTARNDWKNLNPRTKYELCEALNRASGGHAALNPDDHEVLEYNLWLQDNPGPGAQLLMDLRNRLQEAEATHNVENDRFRKLLGE